MSKPVILGADDQSVYLRFLDSSTFLEETGVTAATAGLALRYKKGATGTTTSVAAPTITTLANENAAHTDWGIVHCADGLVRVDIPDAAVPTIEGEETVVTGAATGMIVLPAKLVGVQPIGAPVALDGGAATLAGMLTKLADDNGGADFDAGTDSLQELRDRGDAAWVTATGFEPAGAATAAVATLNDLAPQDVADALKLAPTAGAPADGSVNAQLDAVRDKTDNLPADPADQSEIEAAVTAAQAAVDAAVATVAGYTDSLEAGQTTLAGYTDTLEASASALAAAVAAVQSAATAMSAKILAYVKSLARADATVDADIGGTFDPATDSLEAIRDRGDAVWVSSGSGPGAIEFTYTVTRSDTGEPLPGVAVQVCSDIAGSHVVAGGITNALGVVVFNLDAGTYYLFRRLSGYTFTDPDVEIVSA